MVSEQLLFCPELRFLFCFLLYFCRCLIFCTIDPGLGAVIENLQNRLDFETDFDVVLQNLQTVLGIDSGAAHRNLQTVLGTDSGVDLAYHRIGLDFEIGFAFGIG